MAIKIRNFCAGFVVLCCIAVVVILLTNVKVSYELQKIDPEQPTEQLQKQIQELAQPVNGLIRSKSYISFYINAYSYRNVDIVHDVEMNGLIIPQQIRDLISEYCEDRKIAYTLPQEFTSKKQQELWVDTGQEIFIFSLEDHALRHKVSAARMAKQINDEIERYRELIWYQVMQSILLFLTCFCLSISCWKNNRFSRECMLVAIGILTISMYLPSADLTIWEFLITGIVVTFAIHAYAIREERPTLHYSEALLLFVVTALISISVNMEENWALVAFFVGLIVSPFMKYSLKILTMRLKDILAILIKFIAQLSVVACLGVTTYVFYCYAAQPQLQKMDLNSSEQQVDKMLEHIEQVNAQQPFLYIDVFELDETKPLIRDTYLEDEDAQAIDEKRVPPALQDIIKEYLENDSIEIAKKLQVQGDELWLTAGKSKFLIERYISSCRIYHVKSSAERAQQINDCIDDGYKKMQTSVISLTIALLLNMICMLFVIKTCSILASVLSLLFLLTTSPFTYIIMSLYDYHYEYMVSRAFVTLSIFFIIANAIILIFQILEKTEHRIRYWYFGE